MTSIALPDKAPKAYKEFDASIPKEFVSDPHRSLVGTGEDQGETLMPEVEKQRRTA
jgi:hypothetical protein